MSIETLLAALTEGIEELNGRLKEANRIGEQHNAHLAALIEQAGASAKPAAKTTRRRTKKAEPEAADEAKPAAKTTRRRKTKKATVKMSDILERVAAWFAEVDKENREPRRKVIRAICDDFGVKRLSELSEDKAAEVHEAVEEAIKGFSEPSAADEDDEDDML